MTAEKPLHTLVSSTADTFGCKAKQDRGSLHEARESYQPGPHLCFSLLSGIRPPNYQCCRNQKTVSCLQKYNIFALSIPLSLPEGR